ncbi:MAG: protein kinase [Planctomycetes bacterium]|nr:protein kinase [Planctomycetota bacterium]
MNPGGSSSGGPAWRSEEDYVLARLGVAMGLLDAQVVGPALAAQARALGQGQALSLSQVLVRERRLTPEALLQLKAELARCLRTCPSCGQGRYLAAGPQYREEPCGRCGAPVPVPPAGSTLTPSAVHRREAALRQTATGSQRFERDPFLAPGGGPRVFSHYVLEAQLARGGMGAIYRARHAETGQVVALKVVLAGERATEAQLHRFRREARAQAELEHPNILRIHDSGEWEGILYYTMDLVEGPDLSKALPRLELPERVRVLAAVARAIEHAHARGYVHRDLKPANVLLHPDGRPLVTDFGLAKNLGGETKLTVEGSVLGTPFYMSPEQAAGRTDAIGPRSDVYALGVLLYEMATGTLPFHSESALELYRKIVDEPPLPFADRGVLEPALELICFKAMAKAPEDRYASAADLALDLERWRRGEPPLAQRVSRATLVARHVERHRRSIGAMLGMLAAGLLILAGLAVAVRLGVRRYQADQARIAWQEAATRAAAALEQARAGPPPDEDAADPARAAALDEALERARAARAAAMPPGADPAPLDAALAQGLLARAELALSARTTAGAVRARACAREALDHGANGPAPHLVLARAARRLGAAEEVAAALDAAGDEPRVPLLRALVALDDAADPGALTAALAALERVDGLGRDDLLAIRAARGRALARLGRDEEARAAFEEVVAAAPRPVVGHRRVAEAWTLAGRPREAAEAWRRAHEADPRHAPTARALVEALLALGRPLEALRLVDPGLRDAPPELEVALLRARRWAGEDVTARLDGLRGGALALLRADLDADAELGDALVEADPVARAARARRRAERGDVAGARADLDALAAADVPDGAPHDGRRRARAGRGTWASRSSPWATRPAPPGRPRAPCAARPATPRPACSWRGRGPPWTARRRRRCAARSRSWRGRWGGRSCSRAWRPTGAALPSATRRGRWWRPASPASRPWRRRCATSSRRSTTRWVDAPRPRRRRTRCGPPRSHRVRRRGPRSRPRRGPRRPPW